MPYLSTDVVKSVDIGAIGGERWEECHHHQHRDAGKNDFPDDESKTPRTLRNWGGVADSGRRTNCQTLGYRLCPSQMVAKV